MILPGCLFTKELTCGFDRGKCGFLAAKTEKSTEKNELNTGKTCADYHMMISP